VAKDKREGKKVKPSSEIKDVAKIQDNAAKAREAGQRRSFLSTEQERNISPFSQDPKQV